MVLQLRRTKSDGDMLGNGKGMIDTVTISLDSMIHVLSSKALQRRGCQ